MCKCKILEAANMDAYLFDNMAEEDLAIKDIIRATLDDFANTVDRLVRHPDSDYLNRHLYDLMQFMHQDDCFLFMGIEPEAYINGMLEMRGLNLRKIINIACRKEKNPDLYHRLKIGQSMAAMGQ